MSVQVHFTVLCLTNGFEGRRWLQMLLSELVFVSSYEQCPTSIASIRKVFQSHANLRVIASSLENLTYHRLNYDFDRICHFTGALEQLEIANLLGETSHECTTCPD